MRASNTTPGTVGSTGSYRLPRRRGSACLLAFVTAHAHGASGADKTEPIRIEYRAQAGVGCPDAQQFEAQVFARTKSARAASEGEPARTFLVELRRQGTDFAGSLVIEEKDGASMARRVLGSECGDVATVLALATALAIDPRAELAPREGLEQPSEPTTSSELSEPPAPDLASDETSEFAAEGAPSAWSAGWALGPTAAFGVAPRPAFGGSLLFAFERRPGLIGELGLELAYRRAGAEDINDATATFHFYVARPTLCPLGVEFDAFQAAPCVVLEVGGVTGVGSEIPTSEPQSRFWAAGELMLRLELGFGRNGFVMLDAGVQLPLTRYEFVFENPQTSIHEVPVVAGSCALRVGTSF